LLNNILKFNKLFVLLFLTLGVSCGDETAPAPAPDINAGKFRNPVLTSAPDPWIIRQDSLYYFMHTTGDDLILYKTGKVSALSSATNKIIWKPPATGMNSRNIWAPEIHFVDNAWYVYYAADDGDNANHRMWVLKNESPDPFAGTWVDMGKLNLPDDKWAIDGTIFRLNSQLYFSWSGWEGDVNASQNIYITKMTDPVTAMGPRHLISKPELAWETNGSPPSVNEGPQYLQRGSKAYLVYAASGCWTDQYALGVLAADQSSDLTNPVAWTKSNTPIFSSFEEGDAFAPGHCSFFKSKDGQEDWIMYHANANAGEGCGDERSVRMQQFSVDDTGITLGKPAALDVWIKKPSGE
jgi:GH43 family beta-xylosidase